MSEETDEKKSRRGKAVKPKKGEAAKFEAGSARGPEDFDPATVAAKFHLYWQDGDGDTFIVGSNVKDMPAASSRLSLNGDANGDAELIEKKPQTWSRWTKGAVTNLLRSDWVRVKPRDGEPISEADQIFMHVMQERRLDGSFKAIPGYPAGIYNLQGARVLVRTSPQLLDPKEGDWSTVRALIEGKLDLLDDEGHGIQQADYFHSWMKKAVESLYQGGPGNFQSGPCLVFAGPGDVGKSRIQHQVITPLLGGRSADPAAYLFGKSDFNSEIFSAEHVLMEELEQTSQKSADRVLFGERVKKLVTADRQRLHAKREDAQMVEPFFRMTISINNDPDKMRLLFLLTPDMRDKVMLFLVSDAPLPMPTTTLAEREAFRAQTFKELPAYAHWLMHEYEIPERLRRGRFGVASWHHPELALQLFDDTPAAELLQIIDSAEFRVAMDGMTGEERHKLWDLESQAAADAEGVWEGSAIELEKLLMSEGGYKCTIEREVKKLVVHNKIDRLLGRLAEDTPTRVQHHRTKIQRRWVIFAPPN